MSVLRDVGTRATPQSEPVPGEGQVPNSGGGYAFQVDDWARLERFLVLGVDAGTYYATPRALAVEAVDVIRRCLDADPHRALQTIIDISYHRAPKADPSLFAWAVACAHPEAKHEACDLLANVCRTGTHLFHFAQFVESQRGWGRGLRRAVAQWYQRDDLDGLGYQIVKYRQRDGWTHSDLLRLAHPKPPTPEHDSLYGFVRGRQAEASLPEVVRAYIAACDSADPHETAELLREHRLPWECLQAEHLDSPAVWNALLETGSLPLTATLRNLGAMTARGVLGPANSATRTVCERLTDPDAVRGARLHPVAVLNALVTYRNGRGNKGKLTWTPVSKVVDALDAAFYLAFGAVEPAGKRTVVALDVSGSMSFEAVTNAAFTAAQGACAMAMVTVASEPDVTPVAFSHGIVPVDMSARRRLDDQIAELARIPMGSTDCSLPMLWAAEHGVEADTFVVYTDNETNTGRIHPYQALVRYREKMGIPARLIVVGMTSTGFSIADPNDPGMLDVVGFDTAAPGVISAFSAGAF